MLKLKDDGTPRHATCRARLPTAGVPLVAEKGGAATPGGGRGRGRGLRRRADPSLGVSLAPALRSLRHRDAARNGRPSGEGVPGGAGNQVVDAASLARAFLELIPQMMAVLRRHVRRAGGPELKMGQFRMMLAIYRRGELSISGAAERIGLTLPSASKLADGLERQRLIRRQADQRDRRRALLSLTAAGQRVLQSVMHSAQRHLAELFGPLTATERAFLFCAAQTLRPLFEPQ